MFCSELFSQIKEVENIKKIEFFIIAEKDNPRKIIEYEPKIKSIISSSQTFDSITCVNIFFRIGKAYYDLQDFSKSKENFYRAISFIPFGKENEYAQLYYGISLTLLRKNENDSAIYFCDKALNLYLNQKDKRNIANAYNCKGNLMRKKGKYDLAAANLSMALNIFEEMKDSFETAQVLHNLGNLFIDVKNLTKAEEYLLRSLEIKNKLKLEKQKINTLLSLGNVKFYQKDYEKAEEYFLKSLKWAESNNDKYMQAVIAGNLGSIWSEKKVFDKALKYYRKSLELSTELGRMEGIASSYLWMGGVYFDTKQYDLALTHILKSLEVSQKNQIHEYILQAYRMLSDVYKEMKNYEMALNYFKLYHSLNDSTNNEKIKKNLNEIEAKYKFETKEKEISLLKNQEKINLLEIEKSRSQRMLLIIILILILIILLVFTYFLYQNNKQKMRLQQINLELEKSQQELKNSLETKDKFFAIIAHDLKNPFSMIQSLSSFLNNQFETINDEEKKRIIQTIKNSSDATSELMENLLLWSKTQTGRIIISRELINLSELIEEIINICNISASEKQIRIVFNSDEEVMVYTDKNVISTIIRNLLCNAVKFTETGGTVTIDFSQDSNFTHIHISDTGIGMSEDDLDKLFRLDIDARKIGNHKAKGSGLGLILCKELAELCGGSITVKSQLQKGSKFTLSIPV